MFNTQLFVKKKPNRDSSNVCDSDGYQIFGMNNAFDEIHLFIHIYFGDDCDSRNYTN